MTQQNAAENALAAYADAAKVAEYLTRNLKARAKAIRLDRAGTNWAHAGDAHRLLEALLELAALADNDPDRDAAATMLRVSSNPDVQGRALRAGARPVAS